MQNSVKRAQTAPHKQSSSADKSLTKARNVCNVTSARECWTNML
jgi:hypothetical protein